MHTERPAWRGESDAWRRASMLVLPLLLAVATVVVLFGIGSKSLWYDEAVSIRYATADAARIAAEILSRDMNGSLYYALLRGWVALVGDGEGAVRALSAALAVATVVPVYLVGLRCMGVAGGVLASLLLVGSRMFVEYAQEARSYSMAALFAALGIALIIRAASRGAAARVLYGAVMGIGLYAHLFVGFVTVAQVIWFAQRVRRDGTPLIPALAAIVIPYGLIAIPMALFVLRGSGPTWIPGLSPVVVEQILLRLVGGAVPMLGVAVLALVLPIVAVLRSGRPEHERAILGLLVLSAALPLAIGVGVSAVRPLLVARYFIVVLPAFALLISWTLLSLRPRPVAPILATTLVAVLVIAPTVDWYRSPSRTDWRGAVQAVAAGAAEGDRVEFYQPIGRLPFEYYVDRLGERERLDPLLQPLQDELDAADPSHPRKIWLVMNYQWTGATPPDLAALLDRLAAAGYRSRGKDRPFGDVKIRMMWARPSSRP